MKKNKLLGMVLSIFTILILWGCGSGDNRESYIEELEELNRTDLTALESWLHENDENLNDYFNISHHDANIGGRALS